MPQKIDEAVNEAFETFLHSDVVPIVHLPKTDLYLAELFHGPTGSFKDLALQILPRLVSQVLLPHEKHVYLVATSGDTGGAVIDGFSRLSGQDKYVNLAICKLNIVGAINQRHEEAGSRLPSKLDRINSGRPQAGLIITSMNNPISFS